MLLLIFIANDIREVLMLAVALVVARVHYLVLDFGHGLFSHLFLDLHLVGLSRLLHI